MPIETTDARLTDDRVALGLRTRERVVSVMDGDAPTPGQVLTATADDAATWQTPTGGGGVRQIGLTLDGGTAVISDGYKGHVSVPFAGTITGWTILADQVGSIVVDVWSDSFGNFPPAADDSIAGSCKPTLASAQAAQDLTLTGWGNTSIAAGSVVGFNVEAGVSAVTRVTLTLTVQPS